jgi:hypothetical protein
MKNLESLDIIDDKTVKWVYNGSEVNLSFSRKIFQVEFMEAAQQFLIIADYREVGERNLFIYDTSGKIVANPAMPDIGTTVEGVYSIWYIEGKTDQTVVLLTPQNQNYETKCKFSLIDFTFSHFSLTK